MDLEKQSKLDHDLLVKIDTKLERAIVDIADLKTGMATDITDLKNNKADKNTISAELADHETRLRRLEYLGAIAIAIAYIIPIALKYLFH